MLCEKKEMHCSTGLLVLKLFLTSSFFLGLISSAYSLTHTEHHHAGRSCYHRRTAARNRHHSAARIRLHSSSTEGGARWSYCNPCHSDTCHSCKRELLTMIDEQQKKTFFPTPYLMVFFHVLCKYLRENICVCLQETLENVKKCRNFLSTLIKLASSGKQSSETTANVKELVKNLLVLLSPSYLLWVDT